MREDIGIDGREGLEFRFDIGRGERVGRTRCEENLVIGTRTALFVAIEL